MNNKVLTYFKIRQPLIVYPWLIIVLFILQKFSIPDLHPPWKDILFFFLLNSVLLLIAFIVLNVFIKDRLKAWLNVSILMVVLLEWLIIWELLSKWPFFYEILNSLPHILKQLLYLSLFILIIYVSTKYKRSLLKISQYLNVLLIALIIYQLYAIFSQDTKRITLANKIEIIEYRQQYLNNKPPDIYYIILDAYTSNQSLKDYWDYDNYELTDFLSKKGFCITTDSKSNYNFTEYSLCSSLNMSYLDNIPKKRIVDFARMKNLKQLLKDSQVTKILLKNGYQVINYSSFDLPETTRFYDDFFWTKKSLIAGTAFEMVLKRMGVKVDDGKNTANFLTFKTINPGILNKLKSRDSNHKKPDFVYAHLMMPHEPYLFDEFGGIHENDSAFIRPLKDKYLGQLKYLNKLVINTITAIFNNNQLTHPIIIIGGDHGYRYLSGQDKMKESMTIFNAYYFPDQDYSKIYNSISPVNTFRVLFNKYLNAGFPILKDTSYNVFTFWVNTPVDSLPKTARPRK